MDNPLPPPRLLVDSPLKKELFCSFPYLVGGLLIAVTGLEPAFEPAVTGLLAAAVAGRDPTAAAVAGRDPTTSSPPVEGAQWGTGSYLSKQYFLRIFFFCIDFTVKKTIK